MLQDQIQFRVLLHHGHDLAPDFLGQHRHLDILVVFESVADDGRLVVGNRQHREQFRLRPGFESELVAAAILEYFLHHLPLLIHLDRIYAAVTGFVVVLGDGVLECLVYFAEAVFQNFAEANQDRQGDAAELQVIHELFEIDAARGIFVRVHPHVPVLADRKITFAPTGDIVELARFGDGPAIGGLANRCSFVCSYSCHEISVSFDLPRTASK